MRILRITTVPISLKLLLTGQMKYMRENGYEVLMVSAEGPEIEGVKKSEGCPHTVIPFTRQISPLRDLKSLWLLVKLIRKEKPDIVHTHTPKAGLIGMLAARICGVKLKIHTIAGLPLMTAKGVKRKLLEFVEKLTYIAADYVLPNSNSIMQFVRENKFTSSKKLDMIGRGSSNGIDLTKFSKKSIQKEKLGRIENTIQYNPTNTYILTVGRIVKDKGIVEIVNAFLELRKLKPKLRLVLVGPMEDERREENLPYNILEEIHSNKDIFHINWSDSVEYYMSLADLLVHASYREGFPNVPLQAGAMECPIVCSNIPGNIDIIKDGQTGYYFQVTNTLELVDKIQEAIEKKNQSRKYSDRLRKEIEELYARPQVHKKIKEFYQSKLQKN